MPSSGASSLGLICEFLVLFFVLPLAFRFKPFPFPPIPALWLLAAYGWYRLWSDPSFDRTLLWNAQALPRWLPQIVLVFRVAAPLVGFGVWRLSPGRVLLPGNPLVGSGASPVRRRRSTLSSSPQLKGAFTTLIAYAVIAVWMLAPTWAPEAQAQSPGKFFLGFDRNEYPGDENLAALKQTFSFAGYWLNNPPGEKINTWIGKRQSIARAGLGFLVLFNGRLYAELHSTAAQLGKSDARAAAAAAHREGFRPGTIIFLDQEQGGRMLPEQKAYIFAWVDGVVSAGFRAGIYCSGIAAQESPGVSVVTAEDIRQGAGGRRIAYFVTNDACPPSPGCVFPKRDASPAASGIDFAVAWQFAQSPKRPDVAGACSGYEPDGECYAPGIDRRQHLHVDIDTARSSDPSGGR